MMVPEQARVPDLDLLVEFFRGYGLTDEVYLREHFERFRATFETFRGGWDPSRGRRVLDIGAHWLHQSALWAGAGFSVTAVDLPETFAHESVRGAAEGLAIRLVPCESLEHPEALSTFPDDSFDILLFTEVIEHLAFNPVAMWKQIYRVLAPGARIVVTTPNVYRLGGQAWRPWRLLCGRGLGIPVEEVVGLHTLSHHWKEYSRKEMRQYFALLSPDFQVRCAMHVRSFRASPGGLRSLLEGALPFMRGNLHVEIDLPEKRDGIIAAPGW